MDATVNGPLRAAIIVFGVLAAASSGTLALFTIGETYALATAVIVAITSVIIAFTGTPALGRLVLIMLITTLSATVLIGGYGAVRILAAITSSNGGPVDTPDADQLAAAQVKIDQSYEQSSFQVTLTEAELNAVLLDALAEADTRFRSVTVDIVNAIGAPSLIDVAATFKSGGLTMTGTITAHLNGGQVEVELLSADVGMFTMPGIARDAVEDMIGGITDFNRALADEGADVQQIVIGDDKVTVAGVVTGDSTIDTDTVLAAFGDLSGFAIGDINAPRYDPGVDAATAEGSPLYLALGDSLAAAEGVDGYAEGYVSQVHRELSLRDGTVYGLRNLGVIGETSGTMINGGQLDEAISHRAESISYVTIDIGANDLLGHLSSTDCSEDITADACQNRIALTLDAYAQNIEKILSTLRDTFPDATIIFLEAYNPFALGFEGRIEFETLSNQALLSLNQIASETAERYGIHVADGFSPMRGTTSETTHITDIPPDIHPNETGYDLLTEAVIAAL